jgi:hypothetical protein
MVINDADPRPATGVGWENNYPLGLPCPIGVWSAAPIGEVSDGSLLFRRNTQGAFSLRKAGSAPGVTVHVRT